MSSDEAKPDVMSATNTLESNSGSESKSSNVKGSFRRAKSRASRACEVCHARKVRCDVTVHMPCTNCAAFGCECRIPEVKHRKSKKNEEKKKQHLQEEEKEQLSEKEGSVTVGEHTTAENVAPKYDIDQVKKLPKPKSFEPSDYWANLLDNKVKGPGRVAFMGSTSNLTMLLNDHSESYHYSLPEVSGRSRLSEMEKEDVDILKIRGAFLLPSRELCDDIVEAYFEKVHPIIPLVNRSQFMRQYNDPNDPPSLLLLQSILLAGSRACRNPGLQDASGSSVLASMTFYKRAKALFDANYETDRISVVQSTALLGWWWDNPEEITKNVYFWTHIAITIAQSIGLHRSVEKSSMAPSDKKMWKRIFWCLFVRDRYTASALGRPTMINLEDTDVPMITMEDLNEDEPGNPSVYPQNRKHGLFFIHSVKLSEIVGYVLRQQFNVSAECSRRQNKAPSITQCDILMATWMRNLPEELKYSVADKRHHDFLTALLHSQYYTFLCLVHRSNLIHSDARSEASWSIPFQAAHMIAKILENMRTFNELGDTPAFIVYTSFSAMILMLYQTDSDDPVASKRARQALMSTVESMKEIGKTWLVARRIIKLFEYLEQNRDVREKVVHTARRYFKSHYPHNGESPTNEKPESKRDKKEDTSLSAQDALKSKREREAADSSDKPAKRQALSSNSPATGRGKIGSSPDFYFVTNTSPYAHHSEGFQPSQLFPEFVDSVTYSADSVKSVSTNQDEAPSAVTDEASLPVAEGGGNLGDWYDFLVSNSDGLPDVSTMMTALNSSQIFQ
ncbi:hypothetical protein TRVA0_002S02278 [Trichomonascus vanleenenianus]|uniref:uncharacterized protein n=1 Tax=Trichomonascus vanleenenianus TaxID=2268995 RepID=UPI003ECBACFE